MQWLAIVLGIQVAGLVWAIWLGRPYVSFVKENGKPFKLSFLAPASLAIIDRCLLTERLSVIMTRIQYKLITLHGRKKGPSYSKMLLSELISTVGLLLILTTVLSLAAGGDGMLLLAGVVIVVIMPVVRVRQLDRDVHKKRRKMILELPIYLNKVTLLVNAGETIQTAMMRSFDEAKFAEEHPLYKELQQVRNELANHYPFAQVMDDFSKRCGVQEISIFCTTVLMNYRRGGDEFVLSLRELCRGLWDRHKMLARTLGEEASSKLVFPMIVIFAVVMMIVASPAIMLVQP